MVLAHHFCRLAHPLMLVDERGFPTAHFSDFHGRFSTRFNPNLPRSDTGQLSWIKAGRLAKKNPPSGGMAGSVEIPLRA
jgi:hypothetical protein